ncbi:MAG: hypothetical protein LWY06_17515 [Firmicutes bacterium]|nr:hypothetical protein [Bacillota bacterium]
MLTGKSVRCLFVLLLLLISASFAAHCKEIKAKPGLPQIIKVSDQGEIKVYNGAKFPVEVYISDRSMGRLHSGDSNSWFVNFGTHKVEARWRGGKSTSTTLTISPANPYASWYINEEETY